MRGQKINFNELVGKTIGGFKVVGIGKKVGYHQRLVCECLTCGKIKEFRAYEVIKGRMKSCRCSREKHKDLIGKKYGRLTIISEPFYRFNTKKRYVKARCDCGKEIECNLINLIGGHPKSCGCYFYDVMKSTRKYGDMPTRKMRIYTIRLDIQGRVKGHYARKRYYDKGIKCEWKNFEEFYKDMGDSYKEHVKVYGEKDTTIDRIDSNKNYCKENCRWATYKEQYNNIKRNDTSL